MPMSDRDWYRGKHPSACTCVDCGRRRRGASSRSGRQRILPGVHSGRSRSRGDRSCPTCSGGGTALQGWDTDLGGRILRCPTCPGKGVVPSDHPLLSRGKPDRRANRGDAREGSKPTAAESVPNNIFQRLFRRGDTVSGPTSSKESTSPPPSKDKSPAVQRFVEGREDVLVPPTSDSEAGQGQRPYSGPPASSAGNSGNGEIIHLNSRRPGLGCGGWGFIASLVILLALISVVLLNENTDIGAGISDFMVRVGISDPRPTPTVPALALAPSPTPTTIPPAPSPADTAVVSTSTATPSPTGAPMPRPTFTATPRPIPTVAPAAYAIEVVKTELLNDGQVDILLTVRNDGGEAGEELATMEMSVDSGVLETINVIDRLSPGESKSFALTRRSPALTRWSSGSATRTRRST